MSKAGWTEEQVFHADVLWADTDDVDYPYAAAVGASQWRLRINDFPEEPLYTLFIDDKEFGHLDDWPPGWRKAVRPKISSD